MTVDAVPEACFDLLVLAPSTPLSPLTLLMAEAMSANRFHPAWLASLPSDVDGEAYDVSALL